jgi:hypothetical protein
MNLFDDDEYEYERWKSDNPVINNFSNKQYNYAIEVRNLSVSNKNELNNIINLFKKMIDNQINEKNVILFNIVRVVTKFYINLDHNDLVNLFDNNEKLGIINHPSFFKLIMENRKALSENYSLTDENYLDSLAQELNKNFLLSNRMDMRKKSISSLDDYKNATKTIKAATPIEAVADGKRKKSRRKHSKKHSDGKRRRKHSKKHSDGKRKSRRKHSKKHSGKRRKSLKKHRN